MENVAKLRNELSEVFTRLRADEINVSQAKAMVAASNSMLKSAQLEMEHAKMTGSKRGIAFLTTK